MGLVKFQSRMRPDVIIEAEFPLPDFIDMMENGQVEHYSKQDFLGRYRQVTPDITPARGSDIPRMATTPTPGSPIAMPAAQSDPSLVAKVDALAEQVAQLTAAVKGSTELVAAIHRVVAPPKA